MTVARFGRSRHSRSIYSSIFGVQPKSFDSVNIQAAGVSKRWKNKEAVWKVFQSHHYKVWVSKRPGRTIWMSPQRRNTVGENVVGDGSNVIKPAFNTARNE